ncbi:hypothetical protein ABZ468_10575 [Streptomyces sp. NPDC005708]|uniref:hypothetical protein n=1 Tax=unclassified Streptomyces TaxID=2593676 RepID=UPI0033CD8E4D
MVRTLAAEKKQDFRGAFIPLPDGDERLDDAATSLATMSERCDDRRSALPELPYAATCRATT